MSFKINDLPHINSVNNQSSQAAPVQEKKQTYIGEVSKDGGETRGVALKIIGLWLLVIQKFYEIRGDEKNAFKTAQKFYDLKGDLEGAVEIEFNLAHIKIDENQSRSSKFDDGSLLAKARNIMNMDFFKDLKSTRKKIRDLEKLVDKEKNTATASYLREQINVQKKALEEIQTMVVGIVCRNKENASFGEALKILRSDLKYGVCAGASMDYARKLLKANELSSSEVINIAKEFETGVPFAGVIAHYMYENMPSNVTIESLIEGSLANLSRENHLPGVQKTLVADILLRSIIPEDLYLDFRNSHQQTMNESTADLNHLFGTNRNGYYELRDRIKELVDSKQFNTQTLNQVVKDIVVEYKMNSEQQKALENMAVHVGQYVEAIRKISPVLRGRIEIMESKQELTQKVTKISQEKFESINENFSHSNNNTILEKNTVLNYPELQIAHMQDTNRQNRILQSRGLQVGDNILGVRGAKNDEDALEELKNLPVGVYQMIFSTATGKHATTFVKTVDGNNFFIDPNIGCIQCPNDNPKENVLNVLKTYSAPKDSPGNHRITIQKFSKIRT